MTKNPRTTRPAMILALAAALLVSAPAAAQAFPPPTTTGNHLRNPVTAQLRCTIRPLGHLCNPVKATPRPRPTGKAAQR